MPRCACGRAFVLFPPMCCRRPKAGQPRPAASGTDSSPANRPVFGEYAAGVSAAGAACHDCLRLRQLRVWDVRVRTRSGRQSRGRQSARASRRSPGPALWRGVVYIGTRRLREWKQQERPLPKPGGGCQQALEAGAGCGGSSLEWTAPAPGSGVHRRHWSKPCRWRAKSKISQW